MANAGAGLPVAQGRRRAETGAARPLLDTLAYLEHAMRRLALALPLLTLFGCPVPVDEVACTEIAIASVVVNVGADDGAAITPTITYSVGGADPVACDSFADGQYTCGYEVAGDLTIRVEAEGYDAQEQVVTVVSGECHVVTETLDVTLARTDVDCTDVELPSVIATVAGSSGEALTGVQVAYREGDTAADIACDDRGDGSWACGAEVAGILLVTAVADGHAAESVEVDVAADECHVFTENVAFELDWLPD